MSKKIIEEAFGKSIEQFSKKLDTFKKLNKRSSFESFSLSPLLFNMDGICTNLAFLSNKIRLPYWANNVLIDNTKISQLSDFNFVNKSYRCWSYIGAPFSNSIFYMDPSGMITLPNEFSIESWFVENEKIYRPQEDISNLKIFRPEEFSQSLEFHYTFNEVLLKQVSFVMASNKSRYFILKSHLSNRSFENKSFDFILSIRPYTVEKFAPIFKMNYDTHKGILTVNGSRNIMLNPLPQFFSLSTTDLLDSAHPSIHDESGLCVAKFKYKINLPSMQTRDIFLVIPLSKSSSFNFDLIDEFENSYVQQWYDLLKKITTIEIPYGEMQEFYYNGLASLISVIDLDNIFGFDLFKYPSVMFSIFRALLIYYHGNEIINALIKLLNMGSKEKIAKYYYPYILWLAIESINFGVDKKSFDNLMNAIKSFIPKVVKFAEDIAFNNNHHLPTVIEYLTNHIHSDFEGGFLLAASLYNLHVLLNESKNEYDLKSLASNVYTIVKNELKNIIHDSKNGIINMSQYLHEVVGFSALIRSVIPTRLFDPYEPEIRDFIEHAWTNSFNDNLFIRKLTIPGIDVPTTLDFAHYFVYSREARKSIAIMNALKNYYYPPFGYSDIISPLTHKGRFGEGYSLYSMSKMLQFSRDLIVFEDNDSLVLLSGTAHELIKSPRITKIKMLKSYFGMVELELGASKNQYHVDISVERIPKRIEVTLPKDMRSQRLKIYGATLSSVYPFEEGEILELDTNQNEISLIAKRSF